MKYRLLPALVLITVILNSCYKTGEIIYQQVCKTVQLNRQPFMYLYNNGLLFPTQQQTFTYSGTNRRLVRADIQNSIITGYFTFEYDGNNNLIKENVFIDGSFFKYYTFTYPAGTKNTASAEILVNEYQIGGSSFSYIYKYNTEFQLTSVYSQGILLFGYEYDFGGNCIKESNYNADGTVLSTLEFTGYDNKTNPGRTDRVLQLFINDYSKNNCTQMTGTHYDIEPETGAPVVRKETSVSSFQYNNNLPVTINNQLYAIYDCSLIPSPNTQK